MSLTYSYSWIGLRLPFGAFAFLGAAIAAMACVGTLKWASRSSESSSSATVVGAVFFVVSLTLAFAYQRFGVEQMALPWQSVNAVTLPAFDGPTSGSVFRVDSDVEWLALCLIVGGAIGGALVGAVSETRGYRRLFSAVVGSLTWALAFAAFGVVTAIAYYVLVQVGSDLTAAVSERIGIVAGALTAGGVGGAVLGAIARLGVRPARPALTSHAR